MWSGVWNKVYFRNRLPNTQLPSSVGRASEWWSGGRGFKSHWCQFLTKFILFCATSDLSDNLTEMRILKNPIGVMTNMTDCWSVDSGSNLKRSFNFIFTVRIRMMTGGYVFTGVCPSTLVGGVPHPRSGWGVPPSQVWMGYDGQYASCVHAEGLSCLLSN